MRPRPSNGLPGRQNNRFPFPNRQLSQRQKHQALLRSAHQFCGIRQTRQSSDPVSSAAKCRNKPRSNIAFFIHRAQVLCSRSKNLLRRLAPQQSALSIPQHLSLMYSDQPLKRPRISRLRVLNQLAEKILRSARYTQATQNLLRLEGKIERVLEAPARADAAEN